MSRVTFYGYFGPTTNVKDVGVDAPGVDAFAALIASLPCRTPSAEIVTLPIAHDWAGRPLRFIPVQSGDE